MACEFPFYVENPRAARAGFPYEPRVPVPCGRCPNCVQSRVSGWVFRLRQEEKRSNSSLFVTLTYDTPFVPITPNGYMSLQKKDLQDFFKRLRKAKTSDSKIKYYACGEYGSIRKRPHYHLIIFNSDGDSIQRAWSRYHPEAGTNVLIGQVDFGTVSSSSIAYTAKYMAKGRVVPEHPRDDREKEFSVMSKGLGLNYISDSTIQWHTADLSRLYCVVEGGVKVPLPRYYRDRIYSRSQMDMASMKISRIVEAAETQKRIDYFKLYPSHSEADYQKSRTEEKHSRIRAMQQTQKKRSVD